MGEAVTIRFPRRSEFLEPLRDQIKLNRHRLEGGEAIEVSLKPGGYGGKWSVVIAPDDHETFQAEGSISDPTRFPQRIRVAALALAQEGLHGRFFIRHDRDSGAVSIRRD